MNHVRLEKSPVNLHEFLYAHILRYAYESEGQFRVERRHPNGTVISEGLYIRPDGVAQRTSFVADKFG